MDYLEFTSALVGAVAWPVALIVIAFSQKKPIGRFIDRIKTAEAWGAKLGTDISEDIEKVREQIEVVADGDVVRMSSAGHVPVLLPEQGEDAALKYADRISQELATTSASGSIVASWLELEEELKAHARATGIPWIRFRGQRLTAGSGVDSRLPFGGGVGRAYWADGGRVGDHRHITAI